MIRSWFIKISLKKEKSILTYISWWWITGQIIFHYEDDYKLDLVIHNKNWIDVKSVSWENSQIIKYETIDTYEY